MTKKEHKKYSHLWYLKNKSRHNKLMSRWRKTHRKELLKQLKKYREENKEKISYLKKKWSIKYRDYLREYKRKYYLKNKDKIIKKANDYQKNKRKNDVNFKILGQLRHRIWHVLKGHSKSKKTLDLLGCNIEQLRKHLASKFTKRMSWDNYGTGYNGKGMEQWHIDHIIPCASFDLSKPSEQKKCFHYTNLQPLWAKDNLRKKDKL